MNANIVASVRTIAERGLWEDIGVNGERFGDCPKLPRSEAVRGGWPERGKSFFPNAWSVKYTVTLLMIMARASHFASVSGSGTSQPEYVRPGPVTVRGQAPEMRLPMSRPVMRSQYPGQTGGLLCRRSRRATSSCLRPERVRRRTVLEPLLRDGHRRPT